jgi:hypothetical protein
MQAPRRLTRSPLHAIKASGVDVGGELVSEATLKSCSHAVEVLNPHRDTQMVEVKDASASQSDGPHAAPCAGTIGAVS